MPNPLRAMQELHWRKATIVLTVIAALEFVALAGAGAALLGNPLVSHFKAQAAAAAQPRVRATPQTPASKATLPRNQISVMVLNGNGQSGAAARTAANVRARGYLVGDVTNAATTGYPRSVVMYRPGYAAEATRLAHDLHVPVVTPLDGMRTNQLMGSHLVLVVGTTG